jgi:hypothetical protein
MSKKELNKLQQVQDLLKDLGYKNIVLEWKESPFETHIKLTASKQIKRDE